MQSIDSVETYAYRTRKDLLSDKEEINCNNIIKQKVINSDDVIKEERKEHNPNWPEIPNHPYRIFTTEDSGSGKTNELLNLINRKPDIDKIYVYAKDPFLINKRESIGLKHFNDSKAFI